MISDSAQALDPSTITVFWCLVGAIVLTGAALLLNAIEAAEARRKKDRGR